MTALNEPPRSSRPAAGPPMAARIAIAVALLAAIAAIVINQSY